MEECKKAFKEWNAVIEALGQGKQSILIRKYATTNKEFLLYPTVSYTAKDNYLQMFKEEYKSFVEKNALPNKKNEKVEVKFFSKVEQILERSPQRIGSLNKFHIWSKDHVKSYLSNQKAFIWILRTYELKEPFYAEQNRGMLFGNLKKGASLEGMKPVITDDEFDKIISIF